MRPMRDNGAPLVGPPCCDHKESGPCCENACCDMKRIGEVVDEADACAASVPGMCTRRDWEQQTEERYEVSHLRLPFSRAVQRIGR